MTLTEKDIGNFVLRCVTATLALKMIAGLANILLLDLNPVLMAPLLVEVVVYTIFLRGLWAGKKWARNLLGYGFFVVGVLGTFVTAILAFDSAGQGFLIIPVYAWSALVGSLLLWAPGMSKYMQNLRRA